MYRIHDKKYASAVCAAIVLWSYIRSSSIDGLMHYLMFAYIFFGAVCNCRLYTEHSGRIIFQQRDSQNPFWGKVESEECCVLAKILETGQKAVPLDNTSHSNHTVVTQCKNDLRITLHYLMAILMITCGQRQYEMKKSFTC